MIGADATLQIARYSVINEFRIRQIQIGHDVSELVLRALMTKTRVTLFLLSYRRNTPALIVVRRIHEGVIRQLKQFFSDAFIQGIGIAILKVRAAAAIDQQRVASQQSVCEQVRKMACGVTRRMQWP